MMKRCSCLLLAVVYATLQEDSIVPGAARPIKGSTPRAVRFDNNPVLFLVNGVGKGKRTPDLKSNTRNNIALTENQILMQQAGAEQAATRAHESAKSFHENRLRKDQNLRTDAEGSQTKLLDIPPTPVNEDGPKPDAVPDTAASSGDVPVESQTEDGRISRTPEVEQRLPSIRFADAVDLVLINKRRRNRSVSHRSTNPSPIEFTDDDIKNKLYRKDLAARQAQYRAYRNGAELKYLYRSPPPHVIAYGIPEPTQSKFQRIWRSWKDRLLRWSRSEYDE